MNFQKKINYIKNPINFSIICWIVSILIRLDILLRPLQTHQENINAHILVTLRNWENQGFFARFGNLVLSSEIEGDKHFHASSLGQIFDNEGNGYYVSYPPLAFYLPFFITKLTGISANPLLLRLLSLLVHLFCILLIINYINNKSLNISIQAQNIGIILWFFSPGLLWFMGSIWFSDILVIVFCLLTIFRKDKPDMYLWLLLGMWTEWLAYTLGFVMGIEALWNKNWKKALLLVFLAIFASITWMCLYSLPAGFQTFIDALLNKMEQRSGVSSLTAEGLGYGSWDAWKYILWHYCRQYFFIILIILVALLTKIIKIQRLFAFKEWNLYFFAIVIHHLLLLNWTAVHEFSVVKSAPLIIFIILLIFNNLQIKPFHSGLIITISVLNVFWYYRQNRLEFFSVEEMQKVYEQVKQSDKNKPVYVETEIPLPYIWYYGGRLAAKKK